MELLFLQSSGNTEDVWKWIASGLLAVLGWLLGKKDRRDNIGENSWEKRGSEVLMRISQLEELNKIRTEHPEYHPLANWVNTKVGENDNRISFIEEDIRRLKEKHNGQRGF
jgi:hypothetical protein